MVFDDSKRLSALEATVAALQKANIGNVDVINDHSKNIETHAKALDARLKDDKTTHENFQVHKKDLESHSKRLDEIEKSVSKLQQRLQNLEAVVNKMKK